MFATGVTWLLANFTLVPELVLWVVYQPLLWLWFLVLAVILWRRSTADTTTPPSHEPSQASSPSS